MSVFNLSGKWEIIYSDMRPNKDSTIPQFNGAFCLNNAVPGYWEDMINDFKFAPFYNSIKYNPEYQDIAYPIKERVPDMVLKTVVGTFWYKKDILIPRSNEKSRYIFNCAGVQNRALLFVNGIFADEHCGYSTPFSFDITDLVKEGELNTMVFCVSNHQAYNEQGDMISGCTSRAANRFTGGIIGDIILEVKNEYYIEDVFVGGYLKDTDTFSINTTIKNTNNFCIKWQISDGDALLTSGETDTQNFDIKKGNLELWSDNSPKLYTLKLALYVDGRICDEIEQDFGIRSIGASTDHIILNNKTVFLRGICEHGYFAELVHPESDLEYYLTLVGHLKALGFNFIRFHTFIPCEEYMIAADKLGILLHIESPNNTTLAEWEQIMRFVRRHPSVVIACCGNEMLVDDDMIARLEQCATISHRLAPHILFSPMSALRGVEYCWSESDLGHDIVKEPFKHNPKRLEKIKEFSNVFSSFAQGQLSYERSLYGNPNLIDSWSALYNKPRLSHEICIQGTYIDLSLETKYNGLRIGETALYSSVRKELERQGLSARADTYYKNSCRWQQLLRKNCIEIARRCKKLAGYDFLGVIDHHWHTFGYHCGIMNEFYQMKHGETVENVLRYNDESVLLCDIGLARNYYEKEIINLCFSVSLFGSQNIENATLSVSLQGTDDSEVWHSEKTASAKVGAVSDIADICIQLPSVASPRRFNIVATLHDDNYKLENCWDIWVFPKVCEPEPTDIILTTVLGQDTLDKLNAGADVLMLGTDGLYSNDMHFSIGLPGRSGGNLATVIEKHPLTNTFEHDGFCSWQFVELMDNASCLCYPEQTNIPFSPIIEVASAHQWIVKQSALTEFKVGKGRLLISTFNHTAYTPSVNWWKHNLISYMKSKSFNPEHHITLEQLSTLFDNGKLIKAVKNDNFAGNANDKTMKK